jgi:hypothetical protein
MAAGLKAIVTALNSSLATTLSADIDQTSIDEFLPAITTQKAALVWPVFGTVSVYGPYSLSLTVTYEAHQIPLEIWVKHGGDIATTTTRVRALVGNVAEALQAITTLGGLIETIGFYDGEAFDGRITAVVADEVESSSEIPYIIITVTIPVTVFH